MRVCMNQKNKTKLGKAALFGSALIWGSSFFIMKNTIANVPENFLLGTRFLAGALLLCIFFHKRLGKIDKSYFKTGFVLGGFWFWLTGSRPKDCITRRPERMHF